MRIVRTGGEWLARRRLRRQAGLLTVAAVGTVAGVGASLLWSPLVGSLAVLGTVAAIEPLHRRFHAARPGAVGEASVTETLARLPEGYFLVNDVCLPGRSGNIDHVLIGPSGVLVIETQRYAGVVRCAGDEWFVDHRRVPSVSRRLVDHATAVRELLARAHPALSGSALRWVPAVAVFAHPLCRLKLRAPRVAVVRLSELAAYVRALPRRAEMTPEVACRLAETLERRRAAA